ncbi:hypothetical protein PAXRUDRAFT_530903 [Paxillus rubicundulus Ve08.2h10]|uniref:Uncharacterized protein n=1 Tax=Paxillus rubicundulus Ve08.2h10 TaxID=930991 RepID=A0A0D0D862_9AGAM|nr:hypothetical protein PAXRUDRAFT_530903 [Paxillus rubicundulus Ve08.2h10]
MTRRNRRHIPRPLKSRSSMSAHMKPSYMHPPCHRNQCENHQTNHGTMVANRSSEESTYRAR